MRKDLKDINVNPCSRIDYELWWSKLDDELKQALFSKYCSTLHFSTATKSEIYYMLLAELKSVNKIL